MLAGDDGYDPRIKAPKVQEYTKALGGGVKGMKIAIVKEGFEQAGAEAAVNESVREAAKRLASLGATVEEVSIPMHMMAPAVWTPIGAEGIAQTMMFGDGYGLSRSDLYSTSLMDFHRGWRGQANSLSETTKLFLMLGAYINNNFGPRYYGKAVNISRRVTAAYDKVLAELRPAADADHADEGDAVACAGREPRRGVRARVRDDHQHRAVRYHAPSGDVGALRHGRRTSGRPDAGRPAFR